eukprot:2857512-Pleurochrysis_carterae.AAC.2
MFTARPCMSAVETCDVLEARSHDGPIVDGRSARQFARQNGGDVTLWDYHLSLECYSCLPFSPVSHLPVTGVVLHLMSAVSVIEASHGLESASAPAFGLNFPGETPNKVELK